MVQKALAVVVLVIAVVFWWPILSGAVPYWVGGPYLVVTIFGVRWALSRLSVSSA